MFSPKSSPTMKTGANQSKSFKSQRTFSMFGGFLTNKNTKKNTARNSKDVELITRDRFDSGELEEQK